MKNAFTGSSAAAERISEAEGRCREISQTETHGKPGGRYGDGIRLNLTTKRKVEFPHACVKFIMFLSGLSPVPVLHT